MIIFRQVLFIDLRLSTETALTFVDGPCEDFSFHSAQLLYQNFNISDPLRHRITNNVLETFKVFCYLNSQNILGTEQEKMIKVAIVDDHKIFRKGIIVSFRRYSNIKFVQEADNGRIC